MIQPDSNGLYHPANESDIIDLVNVAIQNKAQVRVRGAAQSVNSGVFTDGYTGAAGGKNINMELDMLRQVTPDRATMQVTVGGGCNLGVDPYDPSGTSQANEANNLFFQLNKLGWAIQNVPNATHQTIAGFISTGSCGGSMQHSFDECIVSVRMIDGTGKVQVFTKSADLDDPFYGVVVSMGLLGIITQVTLQCVPAFNIIGSQNTSLATATEFQFFGPGSSTQPSFQQFLMDTEFAGIIWWPFETLKRAIVWQARTMTASDYNQQTGYPPNFTPKPYESLFYLKKLKNPLADQLPIEAAFSAGFKLIATWPDWLVSILGPEKAALAEPIIEQIFPYVYPLLTDISFPCNTAANPPQQFWDAWLGSLPMDEFENSNNLFDLAYTEMWIPIEKTEATINAMENLYNTAGYSATGFYDTVILAAKSSNFWLSPGYNQASVRINMMWFNKNIGDPVAFFQQFWSLMDSQNIPFRPHWAKSLPAMGAAYMTAKYPKWGQWQALRAKMDPNNIFLTDYWSSQLGI
jgi:FAD/FMN-containing dehydrogenase